MNKFVDGRGVGHYDIFPEAKIDGQVNVTTTMPGIIRAFHWHKEQTDHVCCIAGTMHVILITPFGKQNFYGERYSEVDGAIIEHTNTFPYRNDVALIEHIFLNKYDEKTIVIPTGVIHGFSPAHGNPATMCYYADKKHNLDDEFRLRWDFFGKEIWNIKNM